MGHRLFCVSKLSINQNPKVMKNLSFRSSPHYRMRYLQNFRSEMAFFLLIVFVLFVIGCRTYYKVTQASGNPEEIAAWINKDKYFILHTSAGALHLSGVQLDQPQENLLGIVEPLPAEHMFYKTTKADKITPYKPNKEKPTYEVHLYYSGDIPTTAGGVTIPLLAISKIEVYDKAVGATTLSQLVGVVGVGVGVTAVIIAIAAATKSSCPFVYIGDENGYHFVGELFGGAIRANLERDDYMPLEDFLPVKGEYKLKITNELQERQYTNLAELNVVQHHPNIRFLIDEYGQLQTIRNPITPVTVVSDNMTDHKPAILAVDDAWILFNDDPSINRKMNNITMTFDRPDDAKTGKLVIRGKNSLWLDYIYGKLTEQYGTFYNAYEDQQRTAPAGRNALWAREQGVTLSVYLKEDKIWTYVDDFPVLGPLAQREFVMPIDLTRVKSGEVSVQLRCGFMFWEIDYAAMDFTLNEPMTMITVKPLIALDEQGRDVRSSLMETDKEYLEQPIIGNEATITYTAPETVPGMIQSVFLHNRGYYEYIREYTNEPNLEYLKTMWKPGAFTRFSKERYADQSLKESLWAVQTAPVK